MAETNIKDVKLKIGTEDQFQNKLKDLPLNTLVGITDPINKDDLSSDIINSLTKADNALPQPTNQTTGSTGQVLKKTEAGSEWGDLTAQKADKLTTPRSISLDTAVEATPTNFDGSDNISIPVTEVKESYLQWGGKEIAGTITPIGAALSQEHAANRLAYLNPAAMTFKYSSDSGASWTDYSVSDAVKTQLVTQGMGRAPIDVGPANSVTTGSQTQLEITACNGTTTYLYISPKKLLIEVSSPHGLQVKIETKTGSGTTWNTFGTYTISGWSGWNDIPLILPTLGGGTSQTGNVWYLRLTFIVTSVSNDYATSTPRVNSLRLYGTTAWVTRNDLAGIDTIYKQTYTKDVIFPGSVFAGSYANNDRLLKKSEIKPLTFTGASTATYNPLTGATINIPSGGSGDVTAAGNNTFTGSNTFNKEVVVNNANLKVADTNGYAHFTPHFIAHTPGGTTSYLLKYPSKEGTIALLNDITNIEANPTDSGATTLTKLKIGATVYNLPSGGGSGDVTAAGNNVFTGTNIFNKEVVINYADFKVVDEVSGNKSTLGYNTLTLEDPVVHNTCKLNTIGLVHKQMSDDGATLHNTTLAFENAGSTTTITVPNKTGTIALTSELLNCAMLSGTNNFTGANIFSEKLQVSDLTGYIGSYDYGIFISATEGIKCVAPASDSDTAYKQFTLNSEYIEFHAGDVGYTQRLKTTVPLYQNSVLTLPNKASGILATIEDIPIKAATLNGTILTLTI